MRRVVYLAVMITAACTTPSGTAQKSTSAVESAAPTGAAAIPARVRRYLLFQPPAREAPLVLFIHGYGATPEHVAQVLGLEDAAREKEVYIAAPEGTEDREGMRFWNATDACCDFDKTGVDDVAALTAVMTEIASVYPVSERYIVGFSNGGFMAHRMGCDRSELIRGLVSFAGAGLLDPERCRPARPLDVLQIHGTNDRAVAYAGGHVLHRSDVPAHPGAAETVKLWADRDRCAEPRELAAPIEVSGKPTLVTSYGGCQEGRRVALWTVAGGGHVVGTDPAAFRAALDFLLQRDMK